MQKCIYTCTYTIIHHCSFTNLHAYIYIYIYIYIYTYIYNSLTFIKTNTNAPTDQSDNKQVLRFLRRFFSMLNYRELVPNSDSINIKLTPVFWRTYHWDIEIYIMVKFSIVVVSYLLATEKSKKMSTMIQTNVFEHCDKSEKLAYFWQEATF